MPEETKECAKTARNIWSELDPAQKDNFMARFRATKANKNLGWVRNFQESLSKKKQTRKETVEKHFTRRYTEIIKTIASIARRRILANRGRVCNESPYIEGSIVTSPRNSRIHLVASDVECTRCAEHMRVFKMTAIGFPH